MNATHLDPSPNMEFMSFKYKKESMNIVWFLRYFFICLEINKNQMA